ncbi:AAA family ATPase [Enterococcus sp. AZ126]|uniref:AAA family ATPase n=1 Tax=Enterococcus sp. AZ126 TaxID=2774635 RepID=UPI003F230E7B
MIFYKNVQEVPENISFPVCILSEYGSWNDRGMITSFKLEYIDSLDDLNNDNIISIGEVKISEKGFRHDDSKAFLEDIVHIKLPESPYDKLEDKYFSLGQSQLYYEKLMELPNEVSKEILKSLNDVVFNEDLYDKYSNEHSMIYSLQREVSILSIKGQFKRIITGESLLTEFDFSYIPKHSYNDGIMNFIVKPNSYPPTNIQVVIGKNGVGKTYLLNGLLKTIVFKSRDEKDGTFIGVNNSATDTFSSVIAMSFSAFDKVLEANLNKKTIIPFYYVGLNDENKKNTHKISEGLLDIVKKCVQNGEIDEKDFRKKIEGELEKVERKNNIPSYFIDSLINIKKNSFKFEQWKKSVNILEDDEAFERLNIRRTASFNLDDIKKREEAEEYFDTKLSSGHKIVLLIITKLSELTEEKTLVLFDEPENHLHPPLLSLMFKAMNELLIYRNAVAIVTTHSPVVLQEVPKNCTWILKRIGTEMRFRRPRIETYGENTGTLNREVFRLDVLKSGYHTSIMDAIKGDDTLEDVYNKYNNNLGSEAKELIKAQLFEMRTGEE